MPGSGDWKRTVGEHHRKQGLQNNTKSTTVESGSHSSLTLDLSNPVHCAVFIGTILALATPAHAASNKTTSNAQRTYSPRIPESARSTQQNNTTAIHTHGGVLSIGTTEHQHTTDEDGNSFHIQNSTDSRSQANKADKGKQPASRTTYYTGPDEQKKHLQATFGNDPTKTKSKFSRLFIKYALGSDTKKAIVDLSKQSLERLFATTHFIDQSDPSGLNRNIYTNFAYRYAMLRFTDWKEKNLTPFALPIIFEECKNIFSDMHLIDKNSSKKEVAKSQVRGFLSFIQVITKPFSAPNFISDAAIDRIKQDVKPRAAEDPTFIPTFVLAYVQHTLDHKPVTDVEAFYDQYVSTTQEHSMTAKELARQQRLQNQHQQQPQNHAM